MAERQRRARALMAATAALTLAGCSATHVGDDWQCPLAQGKVCASVAAADPAVPETLAPETRAPETRAPLTLAPLTRGTANLAHDIPHYRRGESRIAAGAPAGRGGEPACESDCDPFAWLGSLFAGFADAGPADPGTAISRRNGDVEAAAPAGPSGNPAAPAPGAARDSAAAAGHPASRAYATDSTAIAPAVPDHAPPTATDGVDGTAGTGDAPGPAFDDVLRTGEVVARIWIAPFVDDEGVYREGSWVRAVIAPAGWRLP